MDKLSAAEQGLHIVGQAVEWWVDATCLTQDDAKRFRVELHTNRAMANGALRRFEEAHKDANRVLELSPDNVRAKLIARNSLLAMRNEVGEDHDRWAGPIDAVQADIKFNRPWVPQVLTNLVYAVFIAIPVLLLYWVLLQRDDETSHHGEL